MCTPGNFSSCSRMPIIRDRKSTRLNSSHTVISYAVFCLKKKKKHQHTTRTLHSLTGDVSLGHPPSIDDLADKYTQRVTAPNACSGHASRHTRLHRHEVAC